MVDWVDACAADDIEAEGVLRFDHGKRTFIIVCNHEDNFHCADGLCTHERVHLAEGLVFGTTIECPKHASIFDCSTGDVETLPAFEILQAYSTRIENDRVLVNI